MGDKPFNPKWDAGKTTLLIVLDGEGETRSVEVMTPRCVDFQTHEREHWFEFDGAWARPGVWRL
jgi:hypothetical protein